MPESIERVIRAGLAREPNQRPGLKDFVETLRASLNQLLADTLVPTVVPTRPTPVNLKLMVSREIRANVYQSVATTQPKTMGLTRDMRKVPQQPEQVSLRTGDRVRIEVIVDQPGYVTVFNVGPTGNLNLLYPDDATATPTPVEANRALHVVDVEMTPPVGRERVFAVWSNEPLPLRLEQLISIGERSGGATRPYQSTRDMKRVKQAIALLSDEAWNTAALEVNHVNGKHDSTPCR